MFSKVFALAFVASAAAQSLTITSPGPNTWWVSDSQNTLSWTPCDSSIQGSIPAFNVIVMNQNQQILAGNLTIIGNQPTFDCGKTFIPQNIPVSTGYTMFLTNAIDTNQVYTTTTFEMRAKGSTYPPPVSSSSPSSTANGTSTATAASGSPSSGKNAADALVLNLKGLFGTVFGAGVITALF